MRRQVKKIEKDAHAGAPASYVYRLSCGHARTGDLRYKRQGKRVQPVTANCGECPVNPSRC